MKNLVIVSAIALSGLIVKTADAQIGLHVNLNLGGPRAEYVQQVPVYNDADYYYLPDVQAYYSVREGSYYYNDGGNWVSAAYLPGRYHDYDWRTARRFAVNEPRPYLHNDAYAARYGGFNGRMDWGFRNDHNMQFAGQAQHFDNNPYSGRVDDKHFEPRPEQGRFEDHSNQPQNFNRGFNNNHDDRQGRYNGGGMHGR